jgi:hypothetical protein
MRCVRATPALLLAARFGENMGGGGEETGGARVNLHQENSYRQGMGGLTEIGRMGGSTGQGNTGCGEQGNGGAWLVSNVTNRWHHLLRRGRHIR